MMQALTRELKLKSKQKWDNCLGLIAKEFKLWEAWVLEISQKHQEDLTKHLRVDLSETEAKWAAQEKIEVLAMLQKSWEKKLETGDVALQSPSRPLPNNDSSNPGTNI